jgi:hypothetical protein
MNTDHPQIFTNLRRIHVPSIRAFVPHSMDGNTTPPHLGGGAPIGADGGSNDQAYLQAEKRIEAAWHLKKAATIHDLT